MCLCKRITKSLKGPQKFMSIVPCRWVYLLEAMQVKVSRILEGPQRESCRSRRHQAIVYHLLMSPWDNVPEMPLRASSNLPPDITSQTAGCDRKTRASGPFRPLHPFLCKLSPYWSSVAGYCFMNEITEQWPSSLILISNMKNKLGGIKQIISTLWKNLVDLFPMPQCHKHLLKRRTTEA